MQSTGHWCDISVPILKQVMCARKFPSLNGGSFDDDKLTKANPQARLHVFTATRKSWKGVNAFDDNSISP